jgi:hypothetical protein
MDISHAYQNIPVMLLCCRCPVFIVFPAVCLARWAGIRSESELGCLQLFAELLCYA